MSDAVVDQEAQRAAFDRYVMPELDVLHRVAMSITRDPVDAEDLTQDTMLRAYRAVGGFDGRHPRAWLLTIMRNAQLNRVRRRRPELLRDPDATYSGLADDSHLHAGPEDLVVGTRLEHEIERAYEALPDPFREVIDLVDVHGLSYREAAEAMAVPMGTVMSRLHRARRRIRSALTAMPNTTTAKGER